MNILLVSEQFVSIEVQSVPLVDNEVERVVPFVPYDGLRQSIDVVLPVALNIVSLPSNANSSAFRMNSKNDLTQ
jgi:hypothetical protein